MGSLCLRHLGENSNVDASRLENGAPHHRLQIKLHGKEAKDKDLSKGIEHLDIV